MIARRITVSAQSRLIVGYVQSRLVVVVTDGTPADVTNPALEGTMDFSQPANSDLIGTL